MKVEHMNHESGYFSSIWSDMAIESTFMWYGQGHSGIIGITLKPQTLKVWNYSLHACNTLTGSLDKMCNSDAPLQTQHKEEMLATITSDSQDQTVLREKLCVSIDQGSRRTFRSNGE